MSHVEHIHHLEKVIPREGDYFGSTVKFSGDGSVLVILAPSFGSGVTNLPTASIYNLVGDEWLYHSDLALRPDIVEADHAMTFCQINYDGTVIAINAQDYNPSTNFNGALYIYTFSGGVWGFKKRIRIQPRIKPAVGPVLNQFSFHFAMSNDGNTIAVSAPWDLNISEFQVGAVYILETSNNWQNWSYIELYNSQASITVKLGYNVAISGDGNYVFAGSFAPDNSGRVTIWKKDLSTGWPDHVDSVPEIATINASDVNLNEYFGVANHLSLGDDKAGCALAANYDGSVLVVGAYKATPLPNSIQHGAAYVFRKIVSTFVETQILQPGDSGSTEFGIFYGWSVSIDDIGSFIAIGAQAEDVSPLFDLGVGYLYEITAGGILYTLSDKQSDPLHAESYVYGAYKVELSRDGEYYVHGVVNQTIDGTVFAGDVHIWHILRDPALLPERAPNYKVLVTEAEANLTATTAQLNDINSDVNRKYKWPDKKVFNTDDELIVVSQGWYPADVWWYEDLSLAHTPV